MTREQQAAAAQAAQQERAAQRLRVQAIRRIRKEEQWFAQRGLLSVSILCYMWLQEILISVVGMVCLGGRLARDCIAEYAAERGNEHARCVAQWGGIGND